MHDDRSLPPNSPFYCGKLEDWTPGFLCDDCVDARRSVESRLGHYLALAAENAPRGGVRELTEAFILRRWLIECGDRNPLCEVGHATARAIHARAVEEIRVRVTKRGWAVLNDRARAIGKDRANGLITGRFLETIESFLAALDGADPATVKGSKARRTPKISQMLDYVAGMSGKPVPIRALRGSPYFISNPPVTARAAMATERGKEFRLERRGRRLEMRWVGRGR